MQRFVNILNKYAFHGANPNFIRDLIIAGIKKVVLQSRDDKASIDPAGFKKISEATKLDDDIVISKRKNNADYSQKVV